MLPPVWCASHVVGEKPSQAAWDHPWVPWEGCRPRRACPATPAAVPPVVGISHVAGHTLPRHPIDPLPWGIIGYQRQIDQTRLKIGAQPALQSLISATMTIRLSLTASSPHSNAGHVGENSIDCGFSLVPDGQTLLRHVQGPCLTNGHGILRDGQG